MTATEIVDAFIAETHGECLPKPYREKMIAMVEAATAELGKRMREMELRVADAEDDYTRIMRDKQELLAALTIERQRREEAEAAARPFAFGDPILEQILFDGIPDDAPGTITATRGSFRKLREHFRKYDSPTDREEERAG